MQLLIIGILCIVCLGETVLLIDLYKAMYYYEELHQIEAGEIHHQKQMIKKLNERLGKNEKTK